VEHRPLHRPLRQPGAISEQLVYPDVLARVELGNPAKRRRLPGRSAAMAILSTNRRWLEI